MAQAPTTKDDTRAEEDWGPRKLTLLGVVTIIIVLVILNLISP